MSWYLKLTDVDGERYVKLPSWASAILDALHRFTFGPEVTKPEGLE